MLHNKPFPLFAGLFLVLALALPTEASATDYRIGPQEKLKLKVHEWPALSDEVTVSPEGMISLPMIGNIKAAGMTTAQLAHEISSQLKDKSKLVEEPFTSVEIVQFRPYYILGDVQRPGDYAYRPGMTVIMAASMAGGAYRAQDNIMAHIGRDAISSSSSLASLEARKLELLVRRARLIAELNGKDTFDLEAGVKYPPDIVDQERAIMQARREELQAQVAGLKKQIQLSYEEISFLKGRAESGVRKQASLEKEIAGLRSLTEKGLGLSARQGELDRLAAQYDGDQREIDTLISRARQVIAQSETSIARLTNERARDARLEIRAATGQLDDIEQQKTMQRRLLAETARLGAANQAIVQRRRSLHLTFTISRQTDAGVKEISARQDDPVEPGDVIVVDQVSSDSRLDENLTNADLPSGFAQSDPRQLDQ
jgi:exopolysaccharide production protein ExoF